MKEAEWSALVRSAEHARAVLDAPGGRLDDARAGVTRWVDVAGGDGADSLWPLFELVMDPAPGRVVERPPRRGSWSAYGYDAGDRLVVVEHHGSGGRDGNVTHRVHADGDVMQLARKGGGWLVERLSPAEGRPRRHVSMSSDGEIRVLLVDPDPSDPLQAVAHDWTGYADGPPDRVTQTVGVRFSTSGEVLELTWEAVDGGDATVVRRCAAPAAPAESLPELMAAWAAALVPLVIGAADQLPAPATVLALRYGHEPTFGDDPVILGCEPVDSHDALALNPADWEPDRRVWIDVPAPEELLPRLRGAARALRHDADQPDPRVPIRAALHDVAASLNARSWPGPTFASEFLVCPVHVELHEIDEDLARASIGR